LGSLNAALAPLLLPWRVGPSVPPVKRPFFVTDNR
jgi:hypothetical protein